VIRVLLADDENLIRSALAQMLDLEDDIDVVAQAANGADALAAARATAPDVAVLDLQLPDLDGITVAKQLAGIVPQCGCMIVTSHGRPGYLKRALASGVRGFLPKTTSAATLAQVVRIVHSGGRHVAGSTGPASSTGCSSTHRPSTSAAPPCPPSPRPWD
jgi:two-component system response regulator DesR